MENVEKEKEKENALKKIVEKEEMKIKKRKRKRCNELDESTSSRQTTDHYMSLSRQIRNIENGLYLTRSSRRRRKRLKSDCGK